MRRDAEIAVVGGGIVGLATARALALHGIEQVLVLEAEERVALHQTGHNSGVIHSGVHYAPGSLKARTCRRGREALYGFCQREDVPFRRSGKLIVAVRDADLASLEELERRGRANGLRELRMLRRSELETRAPGVTGLAGLWVGETGVTDFRAVALALADEIDRAGAEVRTSSSVIGVSPEGRGLRIDTCSGTLHARRLVNCAGLQSDRLARLCGVDPGLHIVPFRGDYFTVGNPPSVLERIPVYPAPDPRLPFLGVHFTPDLEGNVEAGPNAALATGREAYDPLDVDLRDLAETLSYPGFWRLMARYWRTALAETSRSLSRRAFARAARALVPGIEAADLHRSRSGVRAQAIEPDGSLVDDFRIVEGERTIHVLNAPSPAATASLAIGERMARRVLDA